MPKKSLMLKVFLIFLVGAPACPAGRYCEAPLHGSLAYADDVKLLQQEAIYAKEKRDTISGKADRVNLFLEKERFSSQGTEAENFIQELIKKEPSKREPELKIEAPARFLPAKQEKPKPQPVKKSKSWFGFAYGENKAVSDGN